MRTFVGYIIDAGARRVAVINEAFARQYFGTDNPIGQMTKFPVFDRLMPAATNTPFEIVGVTGNVKNRGYELPVLPEAYLPYTVVPRDQSAFLVRTGVKPETMIPAMRQLVWSIDPDVALIDTMPLTDWLERNTYASPKFEFVTTGTFAGVGLMLVLIGIISVMTYTVALQTREIGIRLALGAERGRIIRMVLRKGLMLIGGGLMIGMGASVAVTRLLAHYLQGVHYLDPWTYGGVVLAVAGAGLAACFTPARRAAQVDPLQAIRCE